MADLHIEAPCRTDALLSAAAAAFPDRPAIAFMSRRWSYAELDLLVDQAAAGLQAEGVVSGTRVGLCLPNTPYAVIFFYAVLRAGGIVVSTNPLYVERELAHLVADSGIELMVTIDLRAILPKIVNIARTQPALRRIVVCSLADALPLSKTWLYRIAQRRDIAPIVPGGNITTYRALMRGRRKPSPVSIDPAATAVLQYTGGTTGIPKGAELTHANLTCNTAQIIEVLGGLTPGAERVLGVLPLFHVFALTAVMNIGVAIAAEMILLPRYELKQVLRTVAREKPTMFPAVPTIYAAIIDAARRGKVDLRSVRICISGGAPLPVEVRQRFMALTGCHLIEGYGLSETSPVATITPPGRLYKDGSAGLALPRTIIEIRDLADPSRVLPAGERGEICIRGPQVMRGYWRQEEATRAAMVDGAFRTGDVGYLDSDGYLFLVDRIKDLIIAGGYNVYPRVIEEALYQHPAVREAVVIGVEDRYRGQAPKAFVSLKDGQDATPDSLRAFLADYVSKIEMPREIEIRATLPKTLIGKLSKKELVEEERAKGVG